MKINKKKDIMPPPDMQMDISTDVCTSQCDCPQGDACKAGKCVSTSQPTYCCSKTPCPVNQPCERPNGSAGFCASGGKKCTSHCDCVQGKACVGGHCSTLYMPFYCCYKAGCPTGSACYKKSGSVSYCP